jgi:hypothetical protein
MGYLLCEVYLNLFPNSDILACSPPEYQTWGSRLDVLRM